jgi:hypothetical protein
MAQVVVIETEENVAVAVLDAYISARFVWADRFTSTGATVGGRGDTVEPVKHLA